MARWGSKSDDQQLIELCGWIQRYYDIPDHRILRDHFLLLPRDGTRLYKIKESVTQEEAEKYIIHRPDILITDGDIEIIVLIEIDGSIHHWKHVKRKTAKRNQHYQDYKIPNIIIDTQDLKSVNMDPCDALSIEMERYFR